MRIKMEAVGVTGDADPNAALAWRIQWVTCIRDAGEFTG
jgi:hypothetical protein